MLSHSRADVIFVRICKTKLCWINLLCPCTFVQNGKAIQRHNIVPLYLCLLVYLIVPLTCWKTRGVKLKSWILVVNIHPYLYSGYNQIHHKLVLFSRPPSSTTPAPHSHLSHACPKPVPNHFTKMDANRFYESLPSITMLIDCFII